MTDTSLYAGPSWKEKTAPVALAALEEAGVVAVAMADGTISLRLLDKPETLLKSVKAHEGGLIDMLSDGENLFSAGEDGKLNKIASDGTITEIADFKGAWVEHMAIHESGFIAVSYKKTAVLIGADGKIIAEFSNHPSTVGGLAFDPKGKRLAVTHYNGVTLWWVGGGADQQPQRVNWKGSHLNAQFAPSGKYLLTCMQENSLHGWRLPDFADFAMSGYARKPRSFGWTHEGKWLASSGSPGVICWDCSGKGPMGRAAVVVGQDNPELTTRVACHPELDMVAAGTENGSVYLGRFQDERIVNLKTESKSEVVALSWASSGSYLLAGCDDGTCCLWPFSE
jgi:WD40 repeat protein